MLGRQQGPEQLLVTFFFSPQQNSPAWLPSDGKARNNTGEAGAHLHGSSAPGVTPEYSREKDAGKVICRKSHRGRKYRKVAEALGGSNEARQCGRSPLGPLYTFSFFLSLFS